MSPVSVRYTSWDSHPHPPSRILASGRFARRGEGRHQQCAAVCLQAMQSGSRGDTVAPRETAGKVLTAPATRLGGQAVPPSPRRTIPGWRGRLGRGSGSGPRYKDVDGDVKNDSRTLYTDPTDRPPWHSDGFAPGGRRAIAGISPTGGSQFAQPPPRLALSQGRGKMMSATQRDCSQVATPRPLGGPRLGSMVALRVEFRWRRWRGSPAWCAQLLRVLIAQRPGAAREKTRSGVSERTSMRNRTRVAASTTTERRLRCCHTWDRF